MSVVSCACKLRAGHASRLSIWFQWHLHLPDRSPWIEKNVPFFMQSSAIPDLCSCTHSAKGRHRPFPTHTLLPVPPTHSQLLHCPVLCPLRNEPSNTKLMIWAPRPKETRALQGHDNGYSATFLAPAGPHFLCSPPGWGQLRARQQK